MNFEPNNFKQGFTTFYFRIMNAAQMRTLSSYTEKHHMVPRSLGGSNANTNIARLTPREHLVAHRLLIRMTNGKERNKMLFALQCMTWQSPKHKGMRVELTLGQHAKLREQVATARTGAKWTEEQKHRHSLRKRGLLVEEEKPKVKRVTSEETKEKIRAAMKGRPGKLHTEETKAKLSTMKMGVPGPSWSDERRQQLSDKMMGHKQSEEAKGKLSATRRQMFVEQVLREKHAIDLAVSAAPNLTEAARVLGITRNALYRRLAVLKNT